MAKKKELDGDLRKLIIKHHHDGLGYKKISVILKVDRNTVASIVQKYKRSGITTNLPRSGRRPKTSERIDRSITKIAEIDRRASAPKITSIINEQFGLSLNPQTIRNRLKNHGFKGEIAIKKPWISKKNQKARYAWAKEKVNWTVDDWKKIIWSDETKILLFGSDGITRVWRKAGERYNAKCLKPTVKHGGGNVCQS